MDTSHTELHAHHRGDMVRGILLALISFFTLVDLFAAQAILPTLTERYGVSPAAMGSAVNASTSGMALAGLVVAFFSRKISRRHGIWISLAVLAVPTTLLASADDLQTFAMLRVAQGVCMSAAFTLTMAYLAEECTPIQAAGAMAAYITGNVASNLLGRLIAANIADGFGLATSFYVFAGLNLAGAVLAFFYIHPGVKHPTSGKPLPVLAIWRSHLTTPGLPASFGIGFLILFGFLGVFTYVNYILAQAPFSLSPAQLGLVYFVFLPSLVTTPFAGPLANRWGVRRTVWAAMAISIGGLFLVMASNLISVLVGLSIIGAGTFFAQAATTGFVSGAAQYDRGGASGLYLASYYIGGLIGSSVLGTVFTLYGWNVLIICVGISFLVIMLAALRLSSPTHSKTSTSEKGLSVS